MHRLFVAIPCPEPIKDCLAPAMEGGPAGLRWVCEDDLHCTLRFIGSVDPVAVREIADSLCGLHAPPLALAIDGVGVFDHRRRGALWARVRPVDPLRALHKKIDRRLVEIGLEPERRAYLPHITMARWSGGSIDTRGWAERHAGLRSAAVPIDRFTLFESRLSPVGPDYGEIASYRLQR